MNDLRNFTPNQIYTLGRLLSDTSTQIESVEDYGYNNFSGNVWVQLESGIVLFSFEGRDNISYMTYSEDEEQEWDTYPEALEVL